MAKAKSAPAATVVTVLVPTAPVRLEGGRPLGQAYDYLAPPDIALAPGDYVAVTFARQPLVGVVWDTPPDPAVPKGKLKAVTAKLDLPRMPPVSRKFIDWLATYTLSPPGAVLRMALAGTGTLQKPPTRPARGVKDAPADAPQRPVLSDAQAAGARQLVDAVKARAFSVTLLDGVTGAGKTEVYAEAVEAALAAGQQVLVMLPEIALTTQIIERFAARFGFRPAEWHSGLTPVQRRRSWHSIANGRASLIVGARSALLLPYADLGLIVVDEEHEGAYKQEEGVIYQARDMAVVRARLGGIPAILATATPALETWANAIAHKYARVELPGRYAEAQLPKPELVDLRVETPQKVVLPTGEKLQSWLSPVLVSAIDEQLRRGEQTLLFLNRRGYAPLTLCRHCGYRFQCPQCTAWMVSHERGQKLICHHCGFGAKLPEACPECAAPDSLAACGPGVERLAEEVAARFPQARVAQLTSDSAASPAEARAIIDRMTAGEVDILIGTQLAAKGHHFPHLTLVGVVDADLGLAGGDLRAAERTYQLMMQVSGRAGRGAKPGRVLIQTVDPAQPLMQALHHGTTQAARDVFLAAQLRERQIFKMPPHGRLAALILAGLDRASVERAAKELSKTAPRGDQGAQILGPAPAPLSLLRGRHRVRFLVKAPREARLQGLMQDWLHRTPLPRDVQVTVDIDPYSFM